MKTPTIGAMVTTFTGKRGVVLDLLQPGFPQAARVVVGVLVQIDGDAPILARCHYHPRDVTVEPHTSGHQVAA